MGGCEDGILIFIIYAVAPLDGLVLTAQQFLMMLAEGCYFLFKF